MSNIIDPLVGQIATRIRAERERRRWTLAQLAEASGVSRAMINRIERRESSPTAVVLGKLSAAFQLSVSSLLDFTESAGGGEGAGGGVGGFGVATGDAGTGGVRTGGDGASEGAETTEWRDPDTGYRRRQITGPRFPAEVAEIRLPPGARVPYPAAAYAFIRQAIWVLDGHLTFHHGDTVHELHAGDTLELGDPAPCVFDNTSDAECRYAVILTRASQP